MAGESVLARLAVQITANNAQFNKGLAETNRTLTSFTSDVTNIAKTLGLAFSVQQIASFGLEVSKLAGQAEAVKIAFDRLPESTKVLLDMKVATGETVSELELMKRAVQAANFGISLQALPRLLEFATLRAQQTGQSVDYLVDSIVTGIGRKSTLILDNLGISAAQLKAEFGGASLEAQSIADVAEAVGRIAGRSLEDMAKFSENASTKIERLTASWEDAKVAIGDAANETNILGTSIDALTGSLKLISGQNITFFEKLGAAISAGVTGGLSVGEAVLEDYSRGLQKANQESKKQSQVIREVDRAFTEFNGNIESYAKTIETHVLKTQLLAEFQSRLNKEHTEASPLVATLEERIKDLGEAIKQATTVSDIRLLQKELAAAKKELDNLVNPKEIKPIVIPIDFHFDDAFRSVDFQESINNALLATQFEPFILPIDVEVDPESTEQADAFVDSLKGKWENAAYAFEAVTQTLENSIAAAIRGELSFAQALAGVTLDIIDLYLKQALAAAIAAAVRTGGPLPVGLALAGIGVTAVKALFAKNVGRSGSGGGGGASAAASGKATTQQQRDFRVEFGTAEFRFNGRELQAALTAQERIDGMIGG